MLALRALVIKVAPTAQDWVSAIQVRPGIWRNGIFELRLLLFCNTHAGGQRPRSVRHGPQSQPQMPMPSSPHCPSPSAVYRGRLLRVVLDYHRLTLRTWAEDAEGSLPQVELANAVVSGQIFCKLRGSSRNTCMGNLQTKHGLWNLHSYNRRAPTNSASMTKTAQRRHFREPCGY